MDVIPQLMFQTPIAPVVDHWRGAFPDMKVEEIGAGRLRVTLARQALNLFYSDTPHDFDFTPSVSLFVTCDTVDEVDRIAAHLGQGGEVMMPLDAYDFSPRFTWISDRFGVSWQISAAD